MNKQSIGIAFRFLLAFVSVGFVLLLVVGPALGQLPTATISGVVKDATGAVVPGARVTVANVEIGLTRSGVTAADGTYKFPALPVGAYEIRAENPGFRTEVQSGLKLSVGQDAVLNFSLQVGAVEQTVAVTAEAPMIETTTANVSGLVAENQVRDLPLNARNLMELATLFPGVTIARGAGQSANSGFATKLSIVGTRWTASLFQLDGADINDSSGTAGGAAGILMGVETIREFNVVTNAYSAEYGKHTGGVFNAVTKSGTNSLHGSVFEFLRNDKLDARNFFDRDPNNPSVRSDPPPFKRNQFGFAVGGPIVKDRTFFFGSYEALKERLGITQTYTVPTAGARQGLLPNPSTGRVDEIAVDPAVKPYLESYPFPNGRDFLNGTGEFIRGFSFPTNQNYFTVRGDHRFSDNDSLFGRYTFDDAERIIPNSFNSNSLNSTRNQYVAVGETRLFSPQVINMFLLGFNRSFNGQFPTQISGFTFPTSRFTGFSESLGNIGVTGLSSWGGGSTLPQILQLTAYQVKDDVFYTRGAHSFKFGFNAQRFQVNSKLFDFAGGSWSFGSLGDFLRRTASGFTALTPDSDPAVYTRQTLYGLYAQDDIRLSPRLTLNLGLRYEFITTPNVLRGRVSNLHNYLIPGKTPNDLILGNPFFLNPSLKNFAPRVGFAWDPTGSGKTSIRGGVGIFHDQLMAGLFFFSFTSTPPFFGTGDILAASRPLFPDAYFAQQALLRGAPRSEPFQYGIKQPTIYKYSLDIQRAITSSTSVEVGFAATRGVHLMRVIMANVPAPAQNLPGGIFIPQGTAMFHPAFGRVRPKQSDATSSYYGFRMQVNQRFSHGLRLQGSYTYSKAIDDGSNFAGSLDWTNSPGSSRYQTIKDRGLAAFDIRDALTVNFTYDLPSGNLGGAAGKIANGWQLSGILTVQSGIPSNVSAGFSPTWLRGVFVTTNPDLVPGARVRYDNRNPERYFDPSAFALPPAGFLGNVGRSFLTGPGIATFNFVLAKRTNLSENVNLQVRSEFHNLFNRANFGMPGGGIFDARTAAVSPTVGRITSTSTTSRQIQFGLKLEF